MSTVLRADRGDSFRGTVRVQRIFLSWFHIIVYVAHSDRARSFEILQDSLILERKFTFAMRDPRSDDASLHPTQHHRFGSFHLNCAPAAFKSS